jgi:multidrug efflux pump subunit AcrA (membrane-fusion protein)
LLFGSSAAASLRPTSNTSLAVTVTTIANQIATQRLNLRSTLQLTISDSESMKRLIALAALLICVSLTTACSRKGAQAPANAPEVLVTTVTPQDVPRVLERVATLDGFINANINAQVQGYIISRDYTEGSIVKKGDLLFQIDPRPFEAALERRSALGRPRLAGKRFVN